jgi:membrane-bound ClpP family serine protease
MNDTFSNTNNCCCNSKKNDELKKELVNQVKSSFRFKSLSSVALSVLIAFFPKCPLCWAAYMSLFGFLGLSQLPYMSWLLPVLLLFMGVYLIILYKKSPKKGYIPFHLSLAGAVLLLIGKLFFPLEKWIVVLGMIFIISSSLWLSFGVQIVSYLLSRQNNKLKSIN